MPHPMEPRLREALEHLAADAETQETYLREIGTWPSLDELALDLEDAAGFSEVWTPPVLRGRVRLVDQKLDAMSGQEHAELWQADALKGREWAEVRILAAGALASLEGLNSLAHPGVLDPKPVDEPAAERRGGGIAALYDQRMGTTRGGPVWGTESEELNATILEWPAGEGPPEHVNESRDVALLVLAGSGELTLDGEPQQLAAGEVVVLPKGTRRAVVAGPDGIRYATVHRRRGGLQVRRLGG